MFNSKVKISHGDVERWFAQHTVMSRGIVPTVEEAHAFIDRISDDSNLVITGECSREPGVMSFDVDEMRNSVSGRANKVLLKHLASV